MAVQSHCSPNAFMPDFRKRSRDVLLTNPHQHDESNSRNLFLGGGFNINYSGQNLNGQTVFSGPESELTCNLTTAKKRRRGESDQMNVLTPQQQQQQQLRLLVTTSSGISMPKVQEKSVMPTISASMLSTGVHLCHQEMPRNQLRMASTSNLEGQDPIAYLYNQQNNEIDVVVRMQNERLRLALEAKRTIHHATVMALLEETVGKRLKEKETELQNARLRNAVLEDKVKQMIVESQIWQNVARNNEAMVANLKCNLEVLMIQGAMMGQQIRPEGYGDSNILAVAPVALDDAQSCCVSEGSSNRDDNAQAKDATEEVRKGRMLCRVCRKIEATVLHLPCRHLCLCKECDSRLVSCPICDAQKSASLQVYFS